MARLSQRYFVGHRLLNANNNNQALYLIVNAKSCLLNCQLHKIDVSGRIGFKCCLWIKFELRLHY